MKLGISTACYYPLETELALEEIGASGIKNTEIFFNARSELKGSFVDILLEIKNRYGLNVAAVHPTMSLAEPFMIFSGYERRFNESLDEYARYSEIAAELGAKYIIMHGGKPGGTLSDEEYCERYMLLKQTTLKNGVTVLQENVAKYRSGDAEFLRVMTDILGDDAELCFDIKQAIRCGYEPLELMQEFSRYIRHFHISDHSVAGDCLLPGTGNFDFCEFFKLAGEMDFSGFGMIELYNNAYREYNQIYGSYNAIKSLTNK
ncbi:MAG: sugar phosphate isomerase/epimerase [Clostridia bacterium]|nr:sugar phosphate isomerase/epimerase [Clostridia bacterium]